jgi:hypothetical protein
MLRTDKGKELAVTARELLRVAVPVERERNRLVELKSLEVVIHLGSQNSSSDRPKVRECLPCTRVTQIVEREIIVPGSATCV